MKTDGLPTGSVGCSLLPLLLRAERLPTVLHQSSSCRSIFSYRGAAASFVAISYHQLAA